MLPAPASGPVLMPSLALGERVSAGGTPSAQVRCVANSMATRSSRRIRCTSSEPRSRQLVDCRRTRCCQQTPVESQGTIQQEYKDS